MWADLAPLLAQGGITAGVLWAAVALVRIAVGAERRRADDWRTRAGEWRETAETTAEANALMTSNVKTLTASVELLAASQRETNATLDKMVTLLNDRRGAA